MPKTNRRRRREEDLEGPLCNVTADVMGFLEKNGYVEPMALLQDWQRNIVQVSPPPPRTTVNNDAWASRIRQAIAHKKARCYFVVMPHSVLSNGRNATNGSEADQETFGVYAQRLGGDEAFCAVPYRRVDGAVSFESPDVEDLGSVPRELRGLLHR